MRFNISLIACGLVYALAIPTHMYGTHCGFSGFSTVVALLEYYMCVCVMRQLIEEAVPAGV